MSLGIQRKWVLIPASIITFLLFADVAHVIGYIQRHRFGNRIVTAITDPICDCHHLCDGAEKCRIKTCPKGE